MDSLVEGIGPPGADARDGEPSRRMIREVLAVVRSHLAMEVAFVGRFADGRRWVDYVDADAGFRPVEVGQSEPLEDTYCARVLDGRIPELVVDAAREPGVADLEATRALPVGSHLSVPIYGSDGEAFGTLCCFSRRVDPDLRQRDLDVLRMFAEVVGTHLESLADRQRAIDTTRAHISRVLDEGDLRIALQPVVDLTTDEVCGYEALARFPSPPAWGPERWFTEAERVGMGVALESAAVHAALRLLPRLPDRCHLAVNVSASALIASSSIATMFCNAAGPRLILELTEHQRVDQSDRLTERLAAVRDAGVRVAVDDAGSGYAGLEHILHLGPEVLKLDRVLVQGVAGHPGRQAMCEAMTRFTDRTGAALVAEGVESREDLDALRGLGVRFAQGYLLGRPAVWP